VVGYLNVRHMAQHRRATIATPVGAAR
jgi:hypothetical protein